MSAIETVPFVSQATRNEIAARGQTLYDTLLKSVLEGEHSNRYVVIHVDSGDYAVGRTFTEANRIMQTRYPGQGRLFGRKIGPEPDDDGFAARLRTQRRYHPGRSDTQ